MTWMAPPGHYFRMDVALFKGVGGMFKKILFQLHWFFGITLGVVLAVVGVTGAMLSFEDDILRLMNPGVLSIAPRAGASSEAPLTPAELLERAQQANPGRSVSMVTVSGDASAPARVMFAPPPGGGPRGEIRLLDPYTADALGQPAGQGFFRMTMQIHRWLAGGEFGAQEAGKQIVAASTVACLFFALSGLYLRWPRQPLDWRVWLTLDLRRRGRALLWSLHLVVGTWVLVPYVIMSLSGLTWSYEWYRSGLNQLLGAPQQARMQPPGGGGKPAAPLDVAAVWTAFRAAAPDFVTATLRLPTRPGQPVQISYRAPDAAHDRANNTVTLDPVTLAVKEHRRFAELPLGQQLAGSYFALHSGAYFGLPGLIVFMLSSLLMPLFTYSGWVLYLARRRRRQQQRAAGTGAEITQ